MPRPTLVQDRTHELDRIKALSDGVFAIAMTLLVFNIKIPEMKEFKTPEDYKNPAIFWPAFSSQIPSLVGFIISFLILGIMWTAHCRFVRHIKVVDRSVLFANNLFLLTVALQPIGAGILGTHPSMQGSFQFYSILMILMGAAQLSFWSRVVKKGYQTDDTTPLLARYMKARCYTLPITYVIGFIIACFSTTVAAYTPVLIFPIMKILEIRYARLAEEEQQSLEDKKELDQEAAEPLQVLPGV